MDRHIIEITHNTTVEDLKNLISDKLVSLTEHSTFDEYMASINGACFIVSRLKPGDIDNDESCIHRGISRAFNSITYMCAYIIYGHISEDIRIIAPVDVYGEHIVLSIVQTGGGGV